MDDEKTIGLKDIIKLLLGNKWIYLIMLCSFMVVSLVGLNVYSSTSKDYVSFFDYDVAGFVQDTTHSSFIDGEKFDLRSLINKEKIASYIEQNEALNGLNSEVLVKRGAVKSLKYVIKYKDNDHKMNDSDAAFIQDKAGFELVLDMDYFTKEQAQTFSEVIANQVIELSKEKVNSINYRSYMNYYDKANSYPQALVLAKRNLINESSYSHYFESLAKIYETKSSNDKINEKIKKLFDDVVKKEESIKKNKERIY